MIIQPRLFVAALTVAVGASTAGALTAQAPASGAAKRPAAAAPERSELLERFAQGHRPK